VIFHLLSVLGSVAESLIGLSLVGARLLLELHERFPANRIRRPVQVVSIIGSMAARESVDPEVPAPAEPQARTAPAPVVPAEEAVFA
jgi:hypothetical protein